jgi:hypothetical protein
LYRSASSRIHELVLCLSFTVNCCFLHVRAVTSTASCMCVHSRSRSLFTPRARSRILHGSTIAPRWTTLTQMAIGFVHWRS